MNILNKFITALLLCLLSNTSALAKACDFSIDTLSVDQFYLNGSEKSTLKVAALALSGKEIDMYYGYAPHSGYGYEVRMTAICTTMDGWIGLGCEARLKNTFFGQKIYTKADKIFIPKKDDKSVYSYKGENWTAYFTARQGNPNSHAPPGTPKDPNLYFQLQLYEDDTCFKSVGVELYADPKLVRKHEKEILGTINSIRFSSNDPALINEPDCGKSKPLDKPETNICNDAK